MSSSAVERSREMRGSLAPIMLGLLVALGMALLLAVGWMRASRQDVVQLALYLMSSGLISVGIGIASIIWLRRGPGRLWLKMAVVYTLGVGIALFNIFLTAQLMFLSDHDLPLLLLLLAFAAVVSLGLGYALAHALARRVIALHDGAQAVANGDLTKRVSTRGGDELADLSVAFNRMAAQLESAAAERQQTEVARRDLIAAVSHDLRTPLTSLRAMTEALADGMVDDPVVMARYLGAMRGQIAHLSTLIDDLFELSQIEAGALVLELRRVAPRDLVDNTVEAMQPQASAKGVHLEAQIADLPGALLVSPQKIERVLYNLVSNAIRHTPADGTVRILAQPAIESETLVFEVIDTGEGIAPEDLPHVFERFYRGEKSRSRTTGGAGLGLAIARGIVEAHGGRIWASSALGQGTHVCFSVPWHE